MWAIRMMFSLWVCGVISSVLGKATDRIGENGLVLFDMLY